MTMELEGNILLERAHTRRWVSIIAVVIPVAAFVLLAAWFIRAYIAPPTVAILSPMMLAAAPPTPPAPLARAQSTVAKAPQPVEMAEPVAPPPPPSPARAAPEPAVTALPMFATLAAAPPSLASVPPAYTDPVQDKSSAPPSIMVAETSAIEPSEPIAGAIPLPRTKPQVRVALVTAAVPLPRPRPTDAESPPLDLPSLDRHAVD